MSNKYKSNQIAKQHIAQVMHAYGDKNSLTYQFVVSKDDLLNFYLSRMDDLGYPLRAEPKRDRFVLNTKAMKQVMEEAINKTMTEMEDELYIWVQEDITRQIEDATQDVLDSINNINNNLVVTHKAQRKKSSSSSFLTKLASKIISEISSIMDDIMRGK